MRNLRDASSRKDYLRVGRNARAVLICPRVYNRRYLGVPQATSRKRRPGDLESDRRRAERPAASLQV